MSSEEKEPASQTDFDGLLRRVEELEKSQARFDGAGLLVKWLIYLATPAITAFLYLKDHWKN